jgi:hypothetical protein
MLLKMVMNKAAAEIATGGVPIFHPPNPEPVKTGSCPLGSLRTVARRERSSESLSAAFRCPSPAARD